MCLIIITQTGKNAITFYKVFEKDFCGNRNYFFNISFSSILRQYTLLYKIDRNAACLLSVKYLFLGSINFNFLQLIPLCTLVPSSFLTSKYPLDRLPNMKHSSLPNLTLSNSLKPKTLYGAWFSFFLPPFKRFTLWICLL